MSYQQLDDELYAYGVFPPVSAATTPAHATSPSTSVATLDATSVTTSASTSSTKHSAADINRGLAHTLKSRISSKLQNAPLSLPQRPPPTTTTATSRTTKLATTSSTVITRNVTSETATTNTNRTSLDRDYAASSSQPASSITRSVSSIDTSVSSVDRSVSSADTGYSSIQQPSYGYYSAIFDSGSNGCNNGNSCHALERTPPIPPRRPVSSGAATLGTKTIQTKTSNVEPEWNHSRRSVSPLTPMTPGKNTEITLAGEPPTSQSWIQEALDFSPSAGLPLPPPRVARTDQKRWTTSSGSVVTGGDYRPVLPLPHHIIPDCNREDSERIPDAGDTARTTGVPLSDDVELIKMDDVASIYKSPRSERICDEVITTNGDDRTSPHKYPTSSKFLDAMPKCSDTSLSAYQTPTSGFVDVKGHISGSSQAPINNCLRRNCRSLTNLAILGETAHGLNALKLSSTEGIGDVRAGDFTGGFERVGYNRDGEVPGDCAMGNTHEQDDKEENYHVSPLRHVKSVIMTPRDSVSVTTARFDPNATPLSRDVVKPVITSYDHDGRFEAVHSAIAPSNCQHDVANRPSGFNNVVMTPDLRRDVTNALSRADSGANKPVVISCITAVDVVVAFDAAGVVRKYRRLSRPPTPPSPDSSGAPSAPGKVSDYRGPPPKPPKPYSLSIMSKSDLIDRLLLKSKLSS